MLFYFSLLAFTALLVMRAYPFSTSLRQPSFSCAGPEDDSCDVETEQSLTYFDFAVLYRYRSVLPLPQRLRSFLQHPTSANYAPLSTFADQAAAGMSSSTFDIEANNMMEEDSRLGLDENGTREVKEIMRREGVA